MTKPSTRVPVRVPIEVEPDQDDPAAATLLVAGSFEGRTYRFVLDSGTATTQLPYDDWTAGLPRSGPYRTTGLAGTAEGDLTGPVDLTLGPLIVPGLTVGRAPTGLALLGVTLVDRAFATARPDAFTPTGAASTGTDAAGATVSGTTYVMTGAVVGGMALPPHPVVAVELPRNVRPADRLDLILGFPTIRLATWTFDPTARRWTACRPVS